MIGNKPPKIVMIGMTMKVGVLIAPTYMHDAQVIIRWAMLDACHVRLLLMCSLTWRFA